MIFQSHLMLIYLLFVWPYRYFINPLYRRRPFASQIVRSYIQSRKYPTWTSFFLLYREIQDDNFGDKRFNFNIDGHNYCILRIGCYPYIKYHCTKEPWKDFNTENRLYKFITVLNCDCTDCSCQMPSPSSPLEYRPTPHFVLIILFVLFPLIYLCGRLTVTAFSVLVLIFKSMFSPILQLLYDNELTPIPHVARYIPLTQAVASTVQEIQLEQSSDEQLTDESDEEHELTNTVIITDDVIKAKSKSSTNIQAIQSSLEIQTEGLHDSEHDSGNDEDHSALSTSSAATTSTNQTSDIRETRSTKNYDTFKEKMQWRHGYNAFQINNV
ncbi:Uncharacterized protein ACO02O_08952 [Dirofilaria immitis]